MIESMYSRQLISDIQRHEVAKKNLVTSTEKYLTYLSEHLFETFSIEKVVLRGYTPSFNDGDICYFTSNLNYPDVEFRDDIKMNKEEWVTKEEEYIEPSEDLEKQYQQICKYFTIIPAWALEDLYNSHGFEVIITKGSVVEEDYSCGY